MPRVMATTATTTAASKDRVRAAPVACLISSRPGLIERLESSRLNRMSNPDT